MPSEQLAGCPFCPNGGDVWQPAPMHAIRCSQCGAEGPRGKTDDEMVTLWNTRAETLRRRRAVMPDYDQKLKDWLS